MDDDEKAELSVRLVELRAERDAARAEVLALQDSDGYTKGHEHGVNAAAQKIEALRADLAALAKEYAGAVPVASVERLRAADRAEVAELKAMATATNLILGELHIDADAVTDELRAEQREVELLMESNHKLSVALTKAEEDRNSALRELDIYLEIAAEKNL
jgi:hypothetical protein